MMQGKMEKQYNSRQKRVAIHTYKVGERVQYRNTRNDKRQGGKLQEKYLPLKTFLVIKEVKGDAVILRKPNGKSNYPSWPVHVDDLRRWLSPVQTQRKRKRGAEKDETLQRKKQITGGGKSGRPARETKRFIFEKQE